MVDGFQAANASTWHARESGALASTRPQQHLRLPPTHPPLSPERHTHGQVFIDRPIFAWVIALFIMVLGALPSRSCPSRNIPGCTAFDRYHASYLALRRKRWRTAFFRDRA